MDDRRGISRRSQIVNVEKALKVSRGVLSRRKFWQVTGSSHFRSRLVRCEAVHGMGSFVDRHVVLHRQLRTTWSLSFKPLLLGNPLLEWMHKRSYHIELVRIGDGEALILLLALLQCRQLRQLVPLNLANLLAGTRLKMSILWHAPENVQPHVLLSHGDFDELDIFLILDQSGFPNVKTSFLVDFSNGAVDVFLIFIDFASWKTPVGAFLPTLDQDHLIHVMIEHDGTAHRDPGFVGQEFGKRGDVVIVRPLGHQWAMLKDAQSKGFQGQGRESRIQRPNEVFVEPLCFFNLKTDAFNRFELFSG